MPTVEEVWTWDSGITGSTTSLDGASPTLPYPSPTPMLPGLAENTTGQKRQPPKQTYKAKQTQAEKGSGRVRFNSEAAVLQLLWTQFHLSGFTEVF